MGKEFAGEHEVRERMFRANDVVVCESAPSIQLCCRMDELVIRHITRDAVQLQRIGTVANGDPVWVTVDQFRESHPNRVGVARIEQRGRWLTQHTVEVIDYA